MPPKAAPNSAVASLASMIEPIGQAPAVSPDERYTHVNLGDASAPGKKQYLYSTTGKNTLQEFDAAAQEYDAAQQRAVAMKMDPATVQPPPGFAIADTGTWKNTFHVVSAPVRGAMQDMDRGLPVTNQQQQPGGVGQLLANRTPSNPEGLPQGDPNALPILQKLFGENLSSPEKAGLFFGTLAASQFLAPTSMVAKGAEGVLDLTLPQVFNKSAAAWNAIKTAGSAGAGAVAADVATGEPINPGRLMVELGITALGSGAQGVVTHIIQRYVPQNMQKAVTDDILNQITTRYPQLKNNPNAIDIYASSADNLTRLGQQMSAGIRGGIDTIAENIVQDVNAVMPMRMSVGLQATFRARARDLARAGNAVLDAGGDQKALAAAQKEFNDATVAIGNLVKNEFASFVQTSRPNITDVKPMITRVSGVLNKYKADMTQFEEGAQVLSYLNQASAGKGFDPMMFRDVLMKSYSGNQSQLLQDVRQTLAGGQGQSLMRLPTSQETVPNPDAAIINFAKKWIPGVRHIPFGNTQVNQPMLPYQLPQNTPRPFNFGAQEVGQEAIRSFTERK